MTYTLDKAEKDIIDFIHLAVQASQEQNTPRERPREDIDELVNELEYLLDAVIEANNKAIASGHHERFSNELASRSLFEALQNHINDVIAFFKNTLVNTTPRERPSYTEEEFLRAVLDLLDLHGSIKVEMLGHGKVQQESIDKRNAALDKVMYLFRGYYKAHEEQEQPNTIKAGDYIKDKTSGAVRRIKEVARCNGELGYLVGNSGEYWLSHEYVSEECYKIEILEEEEHKDEVLPQGFWETCDLIFGEFQYKAIAVGDTVLLRPNNSQVKK